MARPSRIITESTVVRWFVYLGFASCSTTLVAALALGWSWLAALAGTLVYGVPTVIMYAQEATHELDRATQAKVQRPSGGTGRWDVEDSGDPTKPPAAPSRSES